MRALFVAEKNDAAKSIAALLSRGSSTRRDSKSKWNKIYQFEGNFLNQKWFVAMTSVSGHLLQHKFPDSFKSWTDTPIGSLFTAPVQKSVIPGMEDIQQTLIEETRRSEILVVWTDCDREGENIGAEIASVCASVKPNLQIYRARFSEITQSSVWNALNNLTTLDQRQVDAVECRSELDLRIGAAFTRLQTLHLRSNFANIFRDTKEVVSYGSCQFPTLGFVVERFKAIQEFIKESFWKIVFQHKRDGICVDFTWNRQRLFDREVVEVIFEVCSGGGDPARVVSVKCKPKSKWRPTALETVELEKLAVRKLKMSAKTAMSIAEKLYSKGYISYPRTETNKYPPDINLRSLVEAQSTHPEWREFALEILERGPNPRNGTKSDEAHPPIHPLKLVPPNELSGQEWALYELIVRHFLASVSTDAKGNETKVQVNLAGEEFTATGLIVTDYGYLKVYKYDKWGDKVLPNYVENEILSDYDLSIGDGQTEPPPLLTEADLIALMDKFGIGTDATHAEHIETIKLRRYVMVNKDGRFVPGYLGLALVDGYDKMGYAMSKPHMRANLESELKVICLGQKNREAVLQDQLLKYRRIFEQSEMKINFLSEAFRQYLKDRETENPANQQIENTEAVNNPVIPNTPRTRRRAQATVNRGTRGSRGNRGRARQHPEVATTNLNDVALLQGLSILNTGHPTRRAGGTARGRGRGRGRGESFSNRTTGSTTTAGQNAPDNVKNCRCGELAIRLQVRKEGPNNGRFFWTCRKDRNDPSKCKYFEWDT